MIQDLKQGSKVILCAIFLGSSMGYAEDVQENFNELAAAPPPEKVYSAPKDRPEYSSRLQIGGDYTYLHFKPDGNSSFHGNLGGAQGLYEYRPLNDFYAGVNFSWKQGTIDGSSAKRSIFYIDVQERMGYTAVIKRGVSEISLYSGVGYHYVNHKLTTSGNEPLRFGYNEFYVPVGFALNNNFYSWFAWGINATWMPQVFSTVSIRPLRGAYWTITRTLTNVRVESPFDFALNSNRRWRILVVPFYEYWQDGHSIAKTTTGIPLALPGNTYNFGGVDLNISYSF